ncbi:hypothetical protein PUN28_020781 [Cardiocondyla obscurior]|uniref:Uncharacterized protein n=1 Tax=Cardiocondyla obscurior TaxID=286306 RepID=A0AAW2E988_9HYME
MGKIRRDDSITSISATVKVSASASFLNIRRSHTRYKLVAATRQSCLCYMDETLVATKSSLRSISVSKYNFYKTVRSRGVATFSRFESE